mmetsp:Transcript_2856/g.4458  ORF Transcript_2856/g.4458 Transcript_2856/m.4458 type:complete len:773 (-) Transcript_2856:288-2606(-)
MSKNTIKKESSVDKVPSSTTKKKETSDKDDNEASAKDLPPGKEIITKPTEHDVLLGRGGGTNNHSGNVKFRQLVNEHKLRYLAASKVDKPKVARDVVKIWRGFTPPGRFLTRTGDVIKKGAGSVKAEGNCWLDVGDRKAREKASQCLRERTPDVKPIIEQMQFRENAQAMAAQQQQQQQAGGGGMYPGMYSFPGSAASVGSGGHSIGTNMSGEAIDNAFNVEHFQVHAANSFQHFSSNGTFASGHSGHSGGGNSYGAHSASGQLHHRHMDPLSMASIATDERTITSGDTIISAAGSTWTDFTPPQVDGNGQGMTPQQQMQQQQQQYMNHHQMNQHRGGGGGAGPTPHYQPHHPMPRPSRPSQTSNTNVTFQGDADLPAGFPVAAVRPRNITPPTPSSSNNNNMSPLDSQSYIPSRHHHQSSYQSVGGSSGGSLPTGNNMYNTTTTSNNSQNFQPEFTNHHTAGNNMDNMYNTTTTNNGGSDFSVAMQQSYGTTGTNGQKSWVSGFNSVDDSQQSLFFSVDGSQGPMSVNRAMMMNSGGASTNMSSMTSSSSTANNDNSNNNNNNNNKQSAAESQEIVWEGQAIICLHEMDSSWFQGYFVPKSSTKPWGLLGVQEEIDECLECADGGYKQITLSVFPPSLTTSTKRNKQSWKHVEWTGGDMMTLKSSFEGDNIRKNKKVEMYTDKMFTGPKAVPYVNQYFVSIVNKLRNAINKDDDDYDDDSDDSDDTSLSSSTKNTSTSLGVLDLIPDVAILTGPMSIVLPKSKNNDDDDTT